jgi:glycosyl hydrolase family 12/cellulose binding protein with CBM2 domain
MALVIRPGRARLGAAGLAAVLAVAGLLTFGAGHARAAASTLCGEQTGPAGGRYIVQNNEYDSSASECVSTDGNADFTVANSAISNATNGSPGAYPSIYQGCHWGNCSTGGLTAAPIQVSALTAGKVTTSWSTTQTGSGAYDVAYDIWYNQTPTTTGQPNGTEMMVWLNHNGSVQPFGVQVASNVSIGGHTYNIWYGTQSVWDTVTYEMTSGTMSVSNLDIGTLTQDMVSRGYTKSSWYLIDVEAGFELWQGGAGLATNSFSVNIGGATSSPSPSPSPSPTPSPTPSATSPGPAACSAAYLVVSSWPGGFQGQVVVRNTGSAALSGWQLGWTFPGSQQISNLWNGSYTQTGATVAVTSASYDSSVPAGGTATVGFTATYTGSNSGPATVTCS